MANDNDGDALPPGFRGRLRMYSMLIGSVMAFKIPRFAINTMVPFVVADLGLPRSVTPSLLAAFHPGYIMTQIPSAFLVASHGPKFVCAIQLAGSAAMMAMVPWAGSLRGSQLLKVGGMSALMLVMGLFQGPMSPVGSQLCRDWYPQGGGPGGVERAWAQRFVSLSHNVCPLLAALLTPRIASRWGWRAVCYIFAALGGGFLVLWQLLASDKPEALGATAEGTAKAAAQDPKPQKKKGPAIDWRILKTRPALALGLFHLASDVGDFTRHQLAPVRPTLLPCSSSSCRPHTLILRDRPSSWRNTAALPWRWAPGWLSATPQTSLLGSSGQRSSRAGSARRWIR